MFFPCLTCHYNYNIYTYLISDETESGTEKRSITCAYIDYYYDCYFFDWGTLCYVYYLCFDEFGNYLGYDYEIFYYFD